MASSGLIHFITNAGRTTCGHAFNKGTMVKTDNQDEVSCQACRRSTYFKAYLKRDEITAKELIAELPNLKITETQREFVKAAMRAMISCVLGKRFNAKIDI